MAGSLSISEAARVWGVHRASVKRWIKRGAVEATKDNAGVWRIAEGQQPPPTVPAPGADLDGSSTAPGRLLDVAPESGPSAAQDSSGAALSARVTELTAALAEAGNRMAAAERDRAVSRREVELLRERIADLQEQHRERLGELREELAASKADRERLLALLETQARTLVDLREHPRSEGLVGVVRRWLFGDREMAREEPVS